MRGEVQRGPAAAHRFRGFCSTFINQVNFSVNYLDHGVLKFRTLGECSLESLLISNRAAVELVTRGARETTAQQPMILLPRAHSSFVSNAIVNHISSLFPTGFIAAERGLPVVKARYVTALFFEKEAGTVVKLRVFLVSPELLKQVADPEAPKPAFETGTHSTR